ncbi:MAG: polysaccharide deacetylase family protein [Wenzhouxiangellaceae bacterium]|nr:polysaccharide deacetylase family protein [Wenzhouxiangellaceae bacterium]
MRALIAAVVLLLQVGLASAVARVDHFVILLYHHVGEDTPASTSVTPQQFQDHLDWLAENDYQVWPLERALDAVMNGQGVPDRVVALTFDDAYASVYTEARPRLAARGWTATIFVNSEAIDDGHRPYMNWGQLRELIRAGFAIGNHSASHGHAGRLESGESVAAWQERVLADVDRAQQRIVDELGSSPRLFAWPYGEDVPELSDAIAQRFEHALAQRSGAVGPDSARWALPRFPMARARAGLDRLELAVRSRPLTLQDAETVPPRQHGHVPAPDAIRFQLATDVPTPDRVACFSAAGEQLSLKMEGDRRVRVELPTILAPGRHKVNCTAPATDGSGDFHWGSFQWVQPVGVGEQWPD